MSLFFGKTVRPQNGLLIFLQKETHSETKSGKSERISKKKSFNKNGKPWKSSRILRVQAKFPHFFVFFHHFSSFFRFFSLFSFFTIFHFFIFSISFMFFHFLSFSLSFLISFFIFFNFLSFFFLSFIVFHCLSFSFIFFVGCSKSVFLGLNFDTISFHNSYVKKSIFGPISGGFSIPLGPLFLFLLLFFSRFFCLSCFYFFVFFSFLFISSFF